MTLIPVIAPSVLDLYILVFPRYDLSSNNAEYIRKSQPPSLHFTCYQQHSQFASPNRIFEPSVCTMLCWPASKPRADGFRITNHIFTVEQVRQAQIPSCMHDAPSTVSWKVLEGVPLRLQLRVRLLGTPHVDGIG
jgi:hypothetical protein